MAKKNLAIVNKDMLIWARSETPFASSIDQLKQRAFEGNDHDE